MFVWWRLGGDQAPSDRTVFNWFREYERGKLDVSDASRSGRPRTAVSEEMVDTVRSIIEDDPHATYEQIECSLGIHPPAIYSILHDHLNLRKICARWVPHQLTKDQKQLRVQFCQESLRRFDGGRSQRVFDLITGDESWFHHYDPATKEQSKAWVLKGSPRPTKVRRSNSSAKRMVAIFFMKFGLIESIALEPGPYINAHSYINACLSQVFDAVSRRREKRGLRGLILHDDNARPHRAWATTEFLTDNLVESYPNPPYSPDLSPCDFFLFPRLKSRLRGIRFNSDHEMLRALNHAIESITKEDFRNCFNDWFSRMQKCIDVGGDYFERIN